VGKECSSQGTREWVAFGERKPEPGQLVVINFTANWTRLRLCYFDTIETWCARTGQEWEDDFRDDIMPCFTEADDYDDWWDADAVAYWSPIWLPPQQGNRDG
jgi:hypothetical protein